MEQLISIGILIIFIGFMLVIAGSILSALKSKKTKVGGGGIIFIGPFPIMGGATSKQIFYILLAVSIILIIIFLILGRKI